MEIKSKKWGERPTCNILLMKTIKPDLINFYNSECFSLTISTCIASIKQKIKTWPNMTVKNVIMHLTESVFMQLGHMQQTIKFGVLTKSQKSTKCTNMVLVINENTSLN